jgi:hypothetical protein
MESRVLPRRIETLKREMEFAELEEAEWQHKYSSLMKITKSRKLITA